MRVLVAPDAFKGTASAASIARALAHGWRAERPGDVLDLAPMADGGEGTIDAFATAFPDAERVPVVVRDPDDRPVHAEWLRLPDGRGLVELASTSGITLLDHPRPDSAHTHGFGAAIAAALGAGARGVVLAIGGAPRRTAVSACCGNSDSACAHRWGRTTPAVPRSTGSRPWTAPRSVRPRRASGS